MKRNTEADRAKLWGTCDACGEKSPFLVSPPWPSAVTLRACIPCIEAAKSGEGWGRASGGKGA